MTDLELCIHTAGVLVATGGWSRCVDRESPYYGTWIHAHPGCMKPRHMGEVDIL